MKKILINDGIHPDGQSMLEEAGYEVNTNKIAQEDLPSQLPNYDAVDHAKSKGIEVINTPAASSKSVAELVFSHLFSLARSLHLSNRDMPSKGDSEFKKLKKAYSKGLELRGKTIGIIGFGRIGQDLGLGMRVLPVDLYIKEATITLDIPQADFDVEVNLPTVDMEDMLVEADFISLHVPFLGKPVLGKEEFAAMKEGVIVLNAARGGTIDEDALLAALESGKVSAAGLDVFENEPTPRKDLLNHPRVSVSPHIGASTMAAQRNIGLELAEKIIAQFG